MMNSTHKKHSTKHSEDISVKDRIKDIEKRMSQTPEMQQKRKSEVSAGKIGIINMLRQRKAEDMRVQRQSLVSILKPGKADTAERTRKPTRKRRSKSADGRPQRSISMFNPLYTKIINKEEMKEREKWAERLRMDAILEEEYYKLPYEEINREIVLGRYSQSEPRLNFKRKAAKRVSFSPDIDLTENKLLEYNWKEDSGYHEDLSFSTENRDSKLLDNPLLQESREYSLVPRDSGVYSESVDLSQDSESLSDQSIEDDTFNDSCLDVSYDKHLCSTPDLKLSELQSLYNVVKEQERRLSDEGIGGSKSDILEDDNTGEYIRDLILGSNSDYTSPRKEKPQLKSRIVSEPSDNLSYISNQSFPKANNVDNRMSNSSQNMNQNHSFKAVSSLDNSIPSDKDPAIKKLSVIENAPEDNSNTRIDSQKGRTLMKAVHSSLKDDADNSSEFSDMEITEGISAAVVLTVKGKLNKYYGDVQTADHNKNINNITHDFSDDDLMVEKVCDNENKYYQSITNIGSNLLSQRDEKDQVNPEELDESSSIDSTEDELNFSSEETSEENEVKSQKKPTKNIRHVSFADNDEHIKEVNASSEADDTSEEESSFSESSPDEDGAIMEYDLDSGVTSISQRDENVRPYSINNNYVFGSNSNPNRSACLQTVQESDVEENIPNNQKPILATTKIIKSEEVYKIDRNITDRIKNIDINETEIEYNGNVLKENNSIKRNSLMNNNYANPNSNFGNSENEPKESIEKETQQADKSEIPEYAANSQFTVPVNMSDYENIRIISKQKADTASVIISSGNVEENLLENKPKIFKPGIPYYSENSHEQIPPHIISYQKNQLFNPIEGNDISLLEDSRENILMEMGKEIIKPVNPERTLNNQIILDANKSYHNNTMVNSQVTDIDFMRKSLEDDKISAKEIHESDISSNNTINSQNIPNTKAEEITNGNLSSTEASKAAEMIENGKNKNILANEGNTIKQSEEIKSFKDRRKELYDKRHNFLYGTPKVKNISEKENTFTSDANDEKVIEKRFQNSVLSSKSKDSNHSAEETEDKNHNTELDFTSNHNFMDTRNNIPCNVNNSFKRKETEFVVDKAEFGLIKELDKSKNDSNLIDDRKDLPLHGDKFNTNSQTNSNSNIHLYKHIEGVLNNNLISTKFNHNINSQYNTTELKNSRGDVAYQIYSGNPNILELNQKETSILEIDSNGDSDNDSSSVYSNSSSEKTDSSEADLLSEQLQGPTNITKSRNIAKQKVVDVINISAVISNNNSNVPNNSEMQHIPQKFDELNIERNTSSTSMSMTTSEHHEQIPNNAQVQRKLSERPRALPRNSLNKKVKNESDEMLNTNNIISNSWAHNKNKIREAFIKAGLNPEVIDELERENTIPSSEFKENLVNILMSKGLDITDYTIWLQTRMRSAKPHVTVSRRILPLSVLRGEKMKVENDNKEYACIINSNQENSQKSTIELSISPNAKVPETNIDQNETTSSPTPSWAESSSSGCFSCSPTPHGTKAVSVPTHL